MKVIFKAIIFCNNVVEELEYSATECNTVSDVTSLIEEITAQTDAHYSYSPYENYSILVQWKFGAPKYGITHFMTPHELQGLN